MTERYRPPVILLTDEIVGHMREPVELPAVSTIKIYDHQVTEKPEVYKAFRNTPDGVPPLASFGDGYRYHITGMTHDEVGFPTQRLDEIDPWGRLNPNWRNTSTISPCSSRTTG
jgi:2-oxoglutarate ferredoxin oxidoreductase subunit alpha